MSDDNKQKIEVSDSVKLAIRDEVELRLDHPSARLAKFIDEEVEKRVALRVKQYWTLATLAAILITGFATLLWRQTIAQTIITARDEATKQLAQAETIKAKQQIFALEADIEQKSQRINALAENAKQAEADFEQRAIEKLRQTSAGILVEKDGSLTVNKPIRFHDSVKFEKSLFSGKVIFASHGGIKSDVVGTPTPYIAVHHDRGFATYDDGTGIVNWPVGTSIHEVAGIFGDFITY